MAKHSHFAVAVIPIFAKLPPTLVRANLEGFKSNRMLTKMDARTLRWAD